MQARPGRHCPSSASTHTLRANCPVPSRAHPGDLPGCCGVLLGARWLKGFLEDCTLQVSPSGHYLDLDLSLLEQKDDLEGFYEEVRKGRRPTLILRTQLSVRVHAIIEKLYNSQGPELRRSLFSLKQLFQEDKDLVPEFVNLDGLTCLIKVGAEADQNYQNYILRALSQIMLFVDGMQGVINHNETVQWLYTLSGSLFRLVVKMALKLLLVFVEYTEPNALLLIHAINTVDHARGACPWSNLMAILEQRNGADTELLVFTMTLINKTLAALPDQDTFYDVTDCLEQQGMERVVQQYLGSKGTDLDLKQQFALYEVSGAPVGPSHTPCPVAAGRVGVWGGRGGLARGSRASFGRTQLCSSSSSLLLSAHACPLLCLLFLSFLLQAAPNCPCLVSAWALHACAPSQGDAPVGAGTALPHLLPLAPTLLPPVLFTPLHALPAGPQPSPTITSIPHGVMTPSDTPLLGRGVPAGGGTAHPAADRALASPSWWQTGWLWLEVDGAPFHQHPMPCSARAGGDLLGLFWLPMNPRTMGIQAHPTREQDPNSTCSPAALAPCKRAAPASPPLPAGSRLARPDTTDSCSTISSDTKFMLDMLYAKGSSEPGREKVFPEVPLSPLVQGEVEMDAEGGSSQEQEGAWLHSRAPDGPVASAHAKLARAMSSVDAETHTQKLENTRMMPIKKDMELTWERLEGSPVQLKIKDLDFTDLAEEEDFDILDTGPVANSSFLPPAIEATRAGALMVPPPPPGVPGCPPPPGPLGLSAMDGPSQAKKKRTVKLFWKELKQLDGTVGPSRFGQATLWASLQNVEVNAAKLEHLFESRSKEVPTSKKAIDGKKVVVVLDPKRSNAINIGLTVLPPMHIIKTAVLNFDEFAVNKEGIEKILTMVPTEEEKQKIQEAQLANPDVPLGSAEQFLLALSSISDLTARLQLWAFKLDYESLEQEIAEPLFDLKVGMEQLARNHTFKCILATLLAMGNFLNGSQSRGFDLGYLEKVSEVKDTVHRQSLLHHLCQMVVEKFPETTDLYSEIASITRSAKVDFDELANSLMQLERRCRTSWDNLKVIAKHETKPVLKSKLTDFLKDSTQRIIVLKVVHRRVLNRFHSFLLYLGYPASTARDVKVTPICKLLREFALEYRTCWERVLQQQKKRAAHRERNKTRGRLITEVQGRSASCHPQVMSPRVPDAHFLPMKSLLTSPTDAPARRSRASRGRSGVEDVPSSPDDASDEIMDQLVKSVTHNTNPRPCANKERRRSRGNRKSLRRTLKSGLSDDLVQALGLGRAPGMEV
uniref:Formin homology 2 domain containing 1 n=1 Tax=Athene cunicularia TaxID=194338 RepID=A0A663MQJ8_ATHCN